jgi:hypothetical protein
MENINLSQIGDDVIVSYLLGRLSLEEEETIDLAMADDKFSERVMTIEEDLIDEYAQGRLSGENRKLVERRLFNTARRREQLAHSMAFFAAAEMIREEEASERVAAENARTARTVGPAASGSWLQRLADLLRLPIPALAAGMAGLALLIAGGAWMAYELRGQSGQIAQLTERGRELSREKNELLASNTQRQQEIAQINAKLNEAQTNNNKLLAQLNNRGTANFTAGGYSIAATEVTAPRPKGGGRGPEPRIEVPGEFKLTLKKGSELALLRTLITNEANSSYRIALNAESGLTVLRMNGLKAKSRAGDDRLRLAFPASLLEPGKYKLEVTGNNSQRTWVFSINVEKQ